MPGIQPLNTEDADEKVTVLLMHVQAESGMIQNFIQTMANSPTILEPYPGFDEALANGKLPATLREKIALYSFGSQRVQILPGGT